MAAKPAPAPPLVRPAQVRMARAALDWSVEDLAKAAGANRNMIASFERGIFEAEPPILSRLRATLEKAGVEFIDGEALGVRLKPKRR